MSSNKDNELEAELERNEKDAVRYRWLLSNYARADVMESAARIGLDKTIDDAILAANKEKP